MIRALWLLACLAAWPAMAEPSPVGRWLTQDGHGVVALLPCGPSICGTVEGITGFQPDGAPPVDWQGRSRCHLTIVSDLQLEDAGIWVGHITNPDDGSTYSIHIAVDPQGRLRMRGYIGIPLLGKTTVWTRYQGRLTPDCHLAG